MKRKWRRPLHRFLSLLLTAAMLVAMPESLVRAETAEQQTTEREMPKNPVHHCAEEYVDWSYVYFGSYPQTEVTGSALTEAITGASYDANGDTWVDEVKYRRISASDMNNNSNFGDSEYRYFKWERIKWKVLQNDGSTLFVVADKGLDCKGYDNGRGAVTWESCTLRNWLNNDFYNTAFSSSEQEAIVEQTVVNEDNPKYGIEGGNDTLDNVYLLSIGEVTNQTYGFCKDDDKSSVSRRFKASDYAHVMGVYGSLYMWWLRSPGGSTRDAASVDNNGYVRRNGNPVGEYGHAVAPALNINLSADFWSLTEDGIVSEMPKNPVNHPKDGEKSDYADWSYVYFGSYPQTEVKAITGASFDSNGDAWVNGEKYHRISRSDTNNDRCFRDSEYRYFKWERMKWRVLENDGDTLFVVADQGLDCKDFNEEYESVTWEDCTLRNWLNNDFYNTAFNSSEQGVIVEQTVVNENNPEYGTEGGNDTKDKVSLLSIGEVTNPEYGFCRDDAAFSMSRRLKTSDYAFARGAGYIDDKCTWWLRSPGYSTNDAAYVDNNGYVSRLGSHVDYSSHAVVPALRINLSSELWSLAEDENAEDIISDFQIDNSAEAVHGGEVTISGMLTLSEKTEASADLLQSEISKITWNSSDSEVAAVTGCTGQNLSDNHSSSLTITITAKRGGTAVIIGTASNGKNAVCSITVKGGNVSEMPENPVHHCVKEDGDTDTTDWSYVYFGSYPQTKVPVSALTPEIRGADYDENGDAWVNGVKYRRTYDGSIYYKWERIKWRVLQNNGSTLFVIAEKGLNGGRYNPEDQYSTWENCTLRHWLNNDFYNMAFSNSEQRAIVEQTVVNEDNPQYGTEGGNDTLDKVFLLSIGEVTNPVYGFCDDYSTHSASRRMKRSDYIGGGITSWWLRSLGGSKSRAVSVDTRGYVDYDGDDVDYGRAVVPALHINLSSECWLLAEEDIISDFQIDDTVEAATDSESTISGIFTLSEKAEASADFLQSEISKIKWRSSNPEVVTVTGCTGQNASDNRSSSLTITIAAKKDGTASIIGTASNGKTVSCIVAVDSGIVSKSPKNPVHRCMGDDEDNGTNPTKWSYVYFGSYPQTKVTGSALNKSITEASYDANGDAWVDGVKYHRTSRSDIYFDEYLEEGKYRYFKWEQIKWRVLQNDGSTLFVVADKGLDTKPYNEEDRYITWENCTLRHWLNNDFYNTAFSDSEQMAIIEQTVVNKADQDFNTEEVLWSSIFVTLVAKKYQLPFHDSIRAS